MQPRSYRARQAAEMLGISPATFWRWVKSTQNFPKPRRLGSRCTVFDADELLAWRDAHVVESKPAA